MATHLHVQLSAHRFIAPLVHDVEGPDAPTADELDDEVGGCLSTAYLQQFMVV